MTDLPKDKREEIVGFYFDLAERLIKCHEVYARLSAPRKTAIAEVRP
jgi:hypothetical protein